MTGPCDHFWVGLSDHTGTKMTNWKLGQIVMCVHCNNLTWELYLPEDKLGYPQSEDILGDLPPQSLSAERLKRRKFVGWDTLLGAAIIFGLLRGVYYTSVIEAFLVALAFIGLFIVIEILDRRARK